MTHRVWSALAGICAFALASTLSLAQTLTWTGAGDGVSLMQAANWSPVAVPGTSNDLVIPAGATTISVNGTANVKSLTTARSIDVQSYLTLTGNLTLQSGVTMTSIGGYEIRFNGTTPQTVSGTGVIAADASGGGLRAQGGATVTTANTVTFRTNAAGSIRVAVDVGGTLNNNSDIISSPGRSIALSVGGTMNNTALVDATGANSRLTITGSGTLNNSGTLRWVGTSASGSCNLTPTLPALGLVNTGTFTVDGANANVSLTGVWSNTTGTFRAQNGGLIQLGGTFTIASIGNFVRTTGTLSFNGATISGTMTPPDGQPWTMDGQVTLNNVTLPVNLTGVGYLYVTDTLTLQNNSVIELNNGYQILIPTGATATITGAGKIGAQSGSGGFRLQSGATATIASGVTLETTNGSFSLGVDTGATLNNQSTFRATAGTSMNANIAGTLNNSGTIEAFGTNARINVTGAGTINNSSILRANGTGATMSLALSSPGSGLVNTGTVRVTGTNAILTLSGPWSNTTGSFITESGALFNLGGTFTIPSIGSFTRTTGTLAFANASISGTMTPPDGLPWIATGALELTNATLPVNLSTNAGYIDVFGTLTLQNNVDITVDNGYEVRLTGPNPSSVVGSGRVVGASGSGGFRARSGGTATVGSGISFVVTGSGNVGVEAGATMNFAGLVSAGPSKSINVSVNGTLNNSGTFEANGANASIAFSGSGTLNNSGTIRVLGGSNARGTLGLSSTLPAKGLVNTGTIRVNGSASTFTLRNTWSNPSGSFIAENSGRFDVGGTFSIAQLGSFTRTTGTLSFNQAFLSGTLTPPDSKPWDFSGDVTLTDVTLPTNLVGFGYVDVVGTLTLQNNAEISVRSGYEVRFVGPGPGLITGTGVITLPTVDSGGIRARTGVTGTVGPNITYRVTSSTGYLNAETGAMLNFQGTFSSSGSSSLGASVLGTLINTGTFQSTGNNTAWNISGSGTFTNSGTISVSGTGSYFGFTTPLVPSNYASNTLTGGTWSTALGGEIRFPASVVIRTIGAGTQVRQSGTAANGISGLSSLTTNNGLLSLNTRTLSVTPVGGTFTNNGTIQVEQASRLAVTGAYAQTATGLSAHSVAGPTTTANGRITASAALVLAGNVQGTVVSPFDPTTAAYSLLSGASRTGTFATASGDSNFAALDSYTGTDAFLQFFACPLYTLQPNDQFACPSGGAIFSTAVGGLQPISLQWKRNNVAVSDGPTASGSVISGANAAVLTITGVTPDDAGSYTLVATNSCGSTTSNPATLGVRSCAYLCFADYDGSGGTPDSTDIAAFFEGWLAGDECADVDCSGGTPDSTDIGVFFDTWLIGGC